MAHARRRFDEARKASPGDSSHAKAALDFIRELYLIERTLVNGLLVATAGWRTGSRIPAS
jgi:hypothetical protein